MRNDNLRENLLKPPFAALVGGLFALPLFIANLFAVGDNPGFDHFFRDVFELQGWQTNPVGTLIIWTAVLLLPIGAYVALRPVFVKDKKGKRTYYRLNIALAVLLLLSFVVFVRTVGEDMYRCDILQVENCD